MRNREEGNGMKTRKDGKKRERLVERKEDKALNSM